MTKSSVTIKTPLSGRKVAKAIHSRSRFSKSATTDRSSIFRNLFEEKGISDTAREKNRGRVSQYDASTGRFTTKDPIQFDGGDTNLYGYVMNDPINSIDPDGLKTKVIRYSGNMGHVAIQVGNNPAQGFYPSDGAVLNTSGIVKDDSQRTDIADAIEFDTTELQEKMLTNIYGTGNGTQYQLFNYNCANFAGNALNSVGIAAPTGTWGPALFLERLRKMHGK